MNRIAMALAFMALAGSAAYAQDRPAREDARGPGGMMQRFDTDNSGDISFEEFAAAMSSRTGLASADADGDGKLTVEEIAAELEKQRHLKRAQRMVERLDTDSDGVLTLEEMESQQRKRFALLDRNDDGVIERAEMRRMMNRHGHGGERGWRGPRNQR